jgi:hypothetical protein
MLLETMSPYYQIPVNVKAIQVFGLGCATYWATLADIYPRVIIKKMDDLTQNQGYFTIDREYIFKRTSIDIDTQLLYDIGLSKAGVLCQDSGDPNKIAINLDRMFEILAESDYEVLEKLRKKAATKKTDEAAAKRAGMIATLSGYATQLAQNPEVQEAYRLWITAMVESKKAKMSKPVVQLFHEAMCAYTQSPELQVKILRDAAASGYTNASWVINALAKSGATRINVPQKTGVAVNTSEAF